MAERCGDVSAVTRRRARTRQAAQGQPEEALEGVDAGGVAVAPLHPEAVGADQRERDRPDVGGNECGVEQRPRRSSRPRRRRRGRRGAGHGRDRAPGARLVPLDREAVVPPGDGVGDGDGHVEDNEGRRDGVRIPSERGIFSALIGRRGERSRRSASDDRSAARLPRPAILPSTPIRTAMPAETTNPFGSRAPSARERDRRRLPSDRAGPAGHRRARPAALLDPHPAGERAPPRRPRHRHRGPRPASSPAGSREGAAADEIPFMPARVVLQDFTGVPCVVDLAAMRDAMARMKGDPDRINPVVPCDLVIDHSVQVDYYGLGARLPAERRAGAGAQRRALPAAQVRPARLPQLPGGAAGHRHRAPGEPRVPRAGGAAPGAVRRAHRLSRHPGRHRLPHHDDQRARRAGLGRRRHRGRGGDAGPAVLHADARGGRHEAHRRAARSAPPPPTWCSRSPRCSARRAWWTSSSSSTARGSRALGLADRATIANMAPEYGATMGFFPVDAETLRYLERTGRSRGGGRAGRSATARSRGSSAPTRRPDPEFTATLELDLGTVVPSLAGPEAPAGPGAAHRAQAQLRREPARAHERRRPGGAARAGGERLLPLGGRGRRQRHHRRARRRGRSSAPTPTRRRSSRACSTAATSRCTTAPW